MKPSGSATAVQAEHIRLVAKFKMNLNVSRCKDLFGYLSFHKNHVRKAASTSGWFINIYLASAEGETDNPESLTHSHIISKLQFSVCIPGEAHMLEYKEND